MAGDFFDSIDPNQTFGFDGLYSAKRCCDGVLKSDGFGTGP
jgi:hypothetical protein